MLPGLGGLNPKKMQAMMKQMGIDQDEIDAERVIIEKSDGKKLVCENPSVTKISMQGNETFQIAGDFTEEAGEKFSEADIKTVMEKTSCSKEKAISALENSDGDLAEAIMSFD